MYEERLTGEHEAKMRILRTEEGTTASSKVAGV